MSRGWPVRIRSTIQFTMKSRGAKAKGKRPPKAEGGAGAGYVYRALAALEQLAVASRTPDELAVALRVHRRTSVRLLEVMSREQYVERDSEDSQRFALTAKIVSIAGTLLMRLDIVRIGYPYVKSLRDRTSEASHLALPSNGMAVQMIQETSFHRLAVKPRVGEQTPLHCSAVGKVLAAYLPYEAEAAIRIGLHRYTERTIVSIAAFHNQLAVVRARGYAVDDQEMEPGTCCVAAPVKNGLGEVVAALGISGPTLRMTRQTLPGLATIVMEEAVRLSRTMGYEGETIVDDPGAVTPRLISASAHRQ